MTVFPVSSAKNLMIDVFPADVGPSIKTGRSLEFEMDLNKSIAWLLKAGVIKNSH